MSGKIIQTAGKNQLGDFAPDFAHFNDDVLFGENWNNQDIDLKTRSIITFVALMSSGITDSSLAYHLQNAKANGVTKEVQEIADYKVKIPMLGKTESLNASVATGIMLYEYVRQKIK